MAMHLENKTLNRQCIMSNCTDVGLRVLQYYFTILSLRKVVTCV